MNRHWLQGFACALGLSLAAGSALADPPAPGAAWNLAYRRTCRTYAPPPGMAFDPGGRSFSWCFGRFGVADGHYRGAVHYDGAATPGVALPGHREMLVEEYRARGDGPLRRRLVVRHRDQSELVALSLVELRAASLSPRGESALVTRADGSRQVVSLPMGRPVMTLPLAGPETHCAMNAAETRLAVATPAAVTVYALDGATPRRLTVIHARSQSAAFSDDGRTLLLDRGDALLSAWREGTGSPPAPPSAPPERVAFTPPPGFRQGAGAPAWLPARSGRAMPPGGPRGEHGLVAQYEGEGVGVGVYTSDAAEFSEADGHHAWARAVVERFGRGDDLATLRSWGRPGSRQAEWRRWAPTPEADGAIVVRVAEHAGLLYRVEIDHADTAAAGRQARSAFVTEPFGAAPGERAEREARQAAR